MKSKTLSIVIPCYNESGNIPLIIDRLKVILLENPGVEVVLVNNGSSDDSKRIFEKELSNLDDGFKLVEISENLGYGYGILKGLEEASGEVLSWTHADMQTDPSDVVRAFALYKKHTDSKILVKGRRKNRKWLEAFFTFGMEIVGWLALRVYLSDINAQPKLFSRSFYENHLKLAAPNDFSLDLYALYQARQNGFSVEEVPVFFSKRIHGEAKGGGGGWRNRVKLIRRTFSYIFELRSRLR